MPGGFGTAWVARMRTFGRVIPSLTPSAQWIERWALPDTVNSLEMFVRTACAATLDVAPAIKIQPAFFERFGTAGIDVLVKVLEICRAAGCLSILDAKRGDAPDVMAAIALTHFGPGAPVRTDAITVHPYLGLAALSPVIEQADAHQGTVLVMLRTSNHDVGPAQMAHHDTDRLVPEALADQITDYNRAHTVHGIGALGAVVGAQPADAVALLRRLPNAIVSLPGLGRPHRRVEDFRAVVQAAGPRAMLPVASGFLEAGPDPDALRRRYLSWVTAVAELDHPAEPGPAPLAMRSSTG
jgi:orotidine-5'-phosphate decarboxylase